MLNGANNRTSSDESSARGHLSGADLVAWEDRCAEGERAERIEAHHAGCQACRLRLAELRETGRRLRRRFAVPDDPAERARVVDDLLGRPGPES